MMYYLRIAMAEEAFLAGKFGGALRRMGLNRTSLYCQILIAPRSAWTPAGNAFSLRHVIKREYNGVFAVVFGMLFLEAARTSGLGSPAWNSPEWQLGLGGSVVAFLLLRFLKKRTRLPPCGRSGIHVVTLRSRLLDGRCGEEGQGKPLDVGSKDFVATNEHLGFVAFHCDDHAFQRIDLRGRPHRFWRPWCLAAGRRRPLH